MHCHAHVWLKWNFVCSPMCIKIHLQNHMWVRFWYFQYLFLNPWCTVHMVARVQCSVSCAVHGSWLHIKLLVLLFNWCVAFSSDISCYWIVKAYYSCFCLPPPHTHPHTHTHAHTHTCRLLSILWNRLGEKRYVYSSSSLDQMCICACYLHLSHHFQTIAEAYEDHVLLMDSPELTYIAFDFHQH